MKRNGIIFICAASGFFVLYLLSDATPFLGLGAAMWAYFLVACLLTGHYSKKCTISLECGTMVETGGCIPIRAVVSGLPGEGTLFRIGITLELENLMFGGVKKVQLQTEGGFARYDYFCENCGKVEVRVKRIKISDPMGTVSASCQAAGQRCFFVLPPEIAAILTHDGHKYVSENVGNKAGKKGGADPDVEGLRDYVPGDRLADIHWKLSGKMDRMAVKEHPKPSPDGVAVILDMRGDRTDAAFRRKTGLALSMAAAVCRALAAEGTVHDACIIGGNGINVAGIRSREDVRGFLFLSLSSPVPGESTRYGDMDFPAEYGKVASFGAFPLKGEDRAACMGIRFYPSGEPEMGKNGGGMQVGITEEEIKKGEFCIWF